ncbi:MAG: tetratricopeptide repeat protein [bacterium]
MEALVLTLIAALVIIGIAYYYFRIYRTPKVVSGPSAYILGLNYLISGELDKAKEKFLQEIHENTDNIDAYLKLGALLRQRGQTSAAIKVHKSLTVRSNLKTADRIEVFRELALDYEQTGALPQAVEYTNQILKISSEHRWALGFRIKLAEKQKDWSAAFDATKKLNSATGNKDTKKLAQYRAEEGRALIIQGKGKEGRIKCRESLKLDSSCLYAYIGLAQSYIAEGREEDALEELNNLIKENPEQAYVAYDALENLYFSLGRFGELQLLYNKILGKRPDDLHAVYALARFLRKKGEINEALRVCRQALEQHPTDLWLRRFMVRTLIEENRTKEIVPIVLDVLGRVLTEHPQFTCKACQYPTEDPLWRCPRCGTLDAFEF